MTAPEYPQLYLISPAEIDPETWPAELERVLDAAPVACIRLALATTDEAQISRAADATRVLAHAHDIPLVVDNHYLLAGRLGLDGVHLTDGGRRVRKARAALDKDAIVGAFCGTSRHDGLIAGEAGADYIAFGPVGTTVLGDGESAETDLFAWWSEMIEIPVVAEGALERDIVERLAPITDFLAFGPEIWGAEDPAAALAAYYDLIRGTQG